MTDRLDRLTVSLKAGEGTAGPLLQDEQFYENMNQAVGELRSLLAGCSEGSEKFLNVKVSIF